jgi:hypothetical protein
VFGACDFYSFCFYFLKCVILVWCLFIFVGSVTSQFLSIWTWVYIQWKLWTGLQQQLNFQRSLFGCT